MNSIKAGISLAVALLILVAVGLSIRWLSGKRNEDERVIIPAGTQALIDSLKRTADSARVYREEKGRLADSVTKLGDALRARTGPARAVAEARRYLADSLARRAQRAETARDSAVSWHAAYVAERAGGDSLRSVVARQDLAAREDSVARAALRTGWDADIRRLADETKARQDLETAIAKANECEVLWVVDCPTRTQAAIVAGIAGVALGIWGDDLARETKERVRAGPGRAPMRISLSVRF